MTDRYAEAVTVIGKTEYGGKVIAYSPRPWQVYVVDGDSRQLRFETTTRQLAECWAAGYNTCLNDNGLVTP